MTAGAAAGPIVLALALGACAALPIQTAAAPEAVRPECAAYEATIYFERDQVSLPASATPLLRETADRIGACRTAGGAIQRITVTSFADSTAVDAAAKADARARALVVRKGLIEVGAPRRAIRIVEAPRQPELLQRRTTVAVEMR